METMMGRALGDLARLASEKWYALMALLGFCILAWVMVVGTPHDDLLIALIAGCMAAFGSAEGETRTFRDRLRGGFGQVLKTRTPVRSLTPLGAFLYALAAVLGIWAIGRAIFGG
ncbi:MAG: hypothetical protein AAGG09_06480 [Pseudomonadota bacterium]